MAISASKAVTAVSRTLTQEAQLAVTQKLDFNIYATPSRDSPNAERLQDGAIQRASVQPSFEQLMYVSLNKKGVGVFQRPALNAIAGGSAYSNSCVFDGQHNRHRVARIYMPQRKHVHNHPTNKTNGNYWCVELENQGTYRSPLMGWGRGSLDPMTNSKATVSCIFGRLSDAVQFAQTNGFGLDVSFPVKHQKWYAKKNYADNFKWKGHPKPEEAYD